MSEYQRCATVKVVSPGSPEGYMIINASDYRADLPAWMYAEGHAYDPAVYPPYVEPVLKAPAPDEATPASATRRAAAEDKK